MTRPAEMLATGATPQTPQTAQSGGTSMVTPVVSIAERT